jgi:hypothetical protein
MEAWQRWIIAPVLKTDGLERVPWVRIPALPPEYIEYASEALLAMRRICNPETGSSILSWGTIYLISEWYIT